MGTEGKPTCCPHEFQAGLNQRNGCKDAENICILFLQEENQAALCEIFEATSEKMGQDISHN